MLHEICVQIPGLTLSSANYFRFHSFLNISPPTITTILHFDQSHTRTHAHRHTQTHTHTDTHTDTHTHTQTKLKISSNMYSYRYRVETVIVHSHVTPYL